MNTLYEQTLPLEYDRLSGSHLERSKKLRPRKAKESLGQNLLEFLSRIMYGSLSMFLPLRNRMLSQSIKTNREDRLRIIHSKILMTELRRLRMELILMKR